MQHRLLLTLALLAVVALTGCDNDATTPNLGNLSVYLTDAPIDLDGVDAVNVVISGLILYPLEIGSPDESEGIVMDLEPIAVGGEATVNLLDYRDGKVVLMASEEIPTGTYEKLRMVVTEAELLRDDDGDPATEDRVEPIFVPSSKVDVPALFTIEAGEMMEIVLDFDAALSVRVNQTPGRYPYILRPVINLAEMTSH